MLCEDAHVAELGRGMERSQSTAWQLRATPDTPPQTRQLTGEVASHVALPDCQAHQPVTQDACRMYGWVASTVGQAERRAGTKRAENTKSLATKHAAGSRRQHGMSSSFAHLCTV